MSLLEIEVDSPLNSNLSFLPIQRTVRGRFDYLRTKEPTHETTRSGPFPGQVIGLDINNGKGYVREPLHEVGNQHLRKEIEGRFSLPPERVEFPSAHVPTWLHWMKKAVESGQAVVVSGRLPDIIDGEPRTRFYIAPVRKDKKDEQIEKLVALAEQQQKNFDRLLEVLASKGK